MEQEFKIGDAVCFSGLPLLKKREIIEDIYTDIKTGKVYIKLIGKMGGYYPQRFVLARNIQLMDSSEYEDILAADEIMEGLNNV